MSSKKESKPYTCAMKIDSSMEKYYEKSIPAKKTQITAILKKGMKNGFALTNSAEWLSLGLGFDILANKTNRKTQKWRKSFLKVIHKKTFSHIVCKHCYAFNVLYVLGRGSNASGESHQHGMSLLYILCILQIF